MPERPATEPRGDGTTELPRERVGDGESQIRPAYYAARPGFWRDWWTLLHPPYTAWILSYVVIGSSLAHHVEVSRLLASVLAFFLAVGLGAHALDELNGRPLRTQIPSVALAAVAIFGLIGALAFGVVGVTQIGWPLIPFMCVGALLVVAYCLELLGGAFHNDLTFALAWGAFPVLTAYVGQTGRLALAPVIAAVSAFALSLAQRNLSTPARLIRRKAKAIDGVLTLTDGETVSLRQETLLAPLERALRATSWAVVLLAASFAVARLS
jgi:hypothetical protein